MNIDYISFTTDFFNSTLTTKHDPTSQTTILSALLDKHNTQSASDARAATKAR